MTTGTTGPTSRPTLVKGARGTRSTIALKLLMAASGLLFIGFVIGHMYGNLKAFGGDESYNGYAEHLRELGEPLLPHAGFLWILRVGLIVALVVHVVTAVMLSRRAWAARPSSTPSRRTSQLVDLLAHDALGRRDAAALPGLAPAQLLDRARSTPRRQHRWLRRRGDPSGCWSTRSTCRG